MTENLIRRGLAYYARLNIPRDRQRDVGQAYGTPSGIIRDRTRTLETRDLATARKRLTPALAAIREEVDAKLTAARMPPLAGAWEAPWVRRAAELRERLRAASTKPYVIVDDESGDPRLREEWTPQGDVVERIHKEAEELEEGTDRATANRFRSLAFSAAPNIKEASETWLAAQQGRRRNQTLHSHRAALDKLEEFLREQGDMPSLAAVRFQDVTRRLAGEFVAWRSKTVGGETVQRELSGIMGLWKEALRRGYVEADPWAGQSAGLRTRRATHEPPKERAYRPAELVTLLRATGEDWAPNRGGYGAALWDVARLGLLTGCRMNELAGLAVGDVIADGTAIAIRAGKTKNARRELPLHPLAQRVVAERLASLTDKGSADPLWPELPPGGYDGKRSKTLAMRFVTARRRILGESDEVDFHSFRRSFATALETAMHEGGRVNPTTIAALMGHEKGTLALDRYSFADRMRPMRDALADAVAKGLPAEVRKALEETAGERPAVVRLAPAAGRKPSAGRVTGRAGG